MFKQRTESFVTKSHRLCTTHWARHHFLNFYQQYQVSVHKCHKSIHCGWKKDKTSWKSKVTAHTATLTQQLCKGKGLSPRERARPQRVLLPHALGGWVTLAVSLYLLHFLTSVRLNSHHTAVSTFASATDPIMHLLSMDIISTMKCLFLNILRFRGYFLNCWTMN